MAVALLIITILAVLYILTGKRDREFIGMLDKKDHPLKFLYPLASVFYILLLKFKIEDFFGSSVLLREIYVDDSVELSRKKQAYRSIASMLIVILGICILVILYTLSIENYLVDGRFIKRNSSGGGSEAYELIYEYGNEKIMGERKVEVDEVRIKNEELEGLQKYCCRYLDSTLIGENESAEKITGNLIFVKTIPKTNVTVEWNEENRWIISFDGELRNKSIEEPVKITVRAELTYYDVKWEYSKDLLIFPYEQDDYERINASIEEYLDEYSNSNPYDDYLELPSDIDGEKIIWAEKEDNTVMMIVVLGVIAIAAIIPSLKQDIHKKQKARREQMLKDYSDIISKFIMLLTAGMTCRAAWSKICQDYQKEYSINKKMRYAYEEMNISYNELRLGKPEIRVYEDFGIRCNVMQYQRFGTLLARNIKRGSQGVISMLELEASEAFADRRENVRRKAEEAGTKLLLPMFGMLIIVFAIVIVPAFSSF